MGFLKKIFVILLLLFAGCTRSIIIENALVNRDGHLQFGGAPERNFYYPVSLNDSLNLKWVSETSGSFNSTSVAVYDKYVFVPDLAGRVYCFNIETGKTIGVEKSKGAVNTAPIVYRTRLYFIVNEYKESNSILYYFDFMTGEYISENIIPGRVSNEIIKTDDGIFVLSDRGTIYKFNYIGMKEWEVQTRVLTISSPIMKDNFIYWGNSNGEIICFDAAKQEIKYRRKIAGTIEASIGIKNNIGFVGDNKGRLTAFKLVDGNELWSTNTSYKIVNIPVMNEETLFIGNLHGDIFAFDLLTGDKKWHTNTRGVINAAPLLFTNILLQPDLNKQLHFIDVDTGAIIKSMNYDSRIRTSPVYFNNMIFICADKDKVYAYEVQTK